ncbi:hypothetical protein Pmani_029670 [Petrolisthes manimaculis]|uniref:Uncharacterized protein n=1 Tax=Petrolisthes manimaculis TaxID=1843537 RepID=A0AAE1NZ40_9EUCA|nr:hypothetical protein Pmani_029670 [Petrolisthes manimaculis]
MNVRVKGDVNLVLYDCGGGWMVVMGVKERSRGNCKHGVENEGEMKAVLIDHGGDGRDSSSVGGENDDMKFVRIG